METLGFPTPTDASPSDSNAPRALVTASQPLHGYVINMFISHLETSGCGIYL